VLLLVSGWFVAPAGPAVINPTLQFAWKHPDGVALRPVLDQNNILFLAEIQQSTINPVFGLLLVDVRDRRTPLIRERLPTRTEPVDLALAGNNPYVAESNDTVTGDNVGFVEIVDLGASPGAVPMSRTATRAVPRALELRGGHLFVAEGGTNDLGVLEVFDVTDPIAPSRVGMYETAGAIDDLAVNGNYAYLVGPQFDLEIIHVMDPSQPRRLSTFNTNLWVDGKAHPADSLSRVTLRGGVAYSVGRDGLHVLEVSDPSRPAFLWGFASSYPLADEHIDFGGFHLSGDHLFLCCSHGG
jgi:hypothetical protein